MEISLCMIVKNEEACLANCLESIADMVDEIIIVDTGSTDATKRIAAEYTDKIYDFEWIDDFAAARNFAFSKGTKEYLMWLDADDILTHPNREEFRKLKSIRNFQYDAVFMLYEATQNGMYTESFYRERIIRSERSLEFRDEIHEYIDLSSILSERILRSPIVITHTKDGTDSKRNLEILEKTIRRGKSSLRLRANYAAELHYAGRKEEALAEYERFFVEDGAKAPEAMRAGESLFRLYMEGGEPLKIKKLVDLLEERCIDRSEYCCMRGEYAEKVLHDAEQAEEWYRKALACEIQTNAFNSVSNRCYYYLPCYNLGQIYAKRGDLIKAKDFLQRALVEMKKYQVMKR